MNPSAAGLQVPARWPRLLVGESADGLTSGRPRARRRRRAPARGEGGGVAGVRDGRCGTSASARGESISTAAGVGDGRRDSTTLASATAALVEPNSKTDVGDCPTASMPAAESYSCRGQITHPCAEHQNADGGAARARTPVACGARGAECIDRGATPVAGPALLRMRMPWRRAR